MSIERDHSENNLKGGVKTLGQETQANNVSHNIPQEYYNEKTAEPIIEENEESGQAGNKFENKEKRQKNEKPLKIFGGICILAAIISFIFSGMSVVDTSVSAQNALENKISTAISVGTVLLSDDVQVEAKDYTISHKSDAKDTKIWVWDYASEDGDYVQVLVNGIPIEDSFMIKHKAKEMTVPAVGEVKIKGIKDGGGGITYAVRYDINGTSYFNSAPEGELNTYTLMRE